MIDKGCPKLKTPLADVETERLSLRRFRHEDLADLARLFAKLEVWRFPYGRGFTEAETRGFLDFQIAAWDADGVGCWLAAEKRSGSVIGYAGLSVPHFLPEILPALEVGWRFDPAVWGTGYATEAAAAALDQAFGPLGLDRICSAPQSINPPSSAVCRRLGMTLERVVTLEPTERRGAVDVDLYWITADEWSARR